MIDEDPTQEFARYHRPERFRGLELLTAHYHAHAFAPHVHEGYCIAMIESGAERFHYRGIEHVATSGMLAIVNPDEVHTGSRAMESGWSYRVFYVPFGILRELTESMGGWIGGTPFFPKATFRDSVLMRSLRTLHASLTGPASLLEQESRWCDAMGLLLRRHARGLTFHERDLNGGDAIAKVRERLRERVAENMGLSQLATEVGLSAWHLNRLFRQRYGLPPHAYQLQLRLARARLLLQGPGSIAGIAGELGFADQAHLSRMFKRTFGVTPAGFQRSA
jgi:AraC-like DNA-binding protein